MQGRRRGGFSPHVPLGLLCCESPCEDVLVLSGGSGEPIWGVACPPVPPPAATKLGGTPQGAVGMLSLARRLWPPRQAQEKEEKECCHGGCGKPRRNPKARQDTEP